MSPFRPERSLLAAALVVLLPGVLFAQAGMVRVPAGAYVPLYSNTPGAAVGVAAFRMDVREVTRGDYLAFVRAHPDWERGHVRAIFADAGYLDDWRAPLDPGEFPSPDSPVTSVSWFAARAYCASKGKRLPTVDEWEFAASASETRRDATRDPAFVRRVLALYGARAAKAMPDRTVGFRNVYGVEALHGGAWEWTEDFNSSLVSNDSREGGGTTRHTDFRAVCAGGAIGASDPENYPAFMRFAFRAALNGRSNVRSLGFRCAAGT